ncbi:unnamed protein product [Oppiella nova]|uniref:Uncharacterized protein n=1 Tax=Oppiella nova TaxID=334625 RepID=A0A7R9MB56_9ACAR|nr:unnamed protein product [Oppiella nova]CAG2173046.1 unnamed protein product [Oppiella nova]
MDGYASVTSDWSRLYFMSFYIMTLVVITIVVALVLETFLFRIQYRHKMGDIDSTFLARDTHITVDVALNSEELSFCVENARNVQNISQLLRYSNYLFNSRSYSDSTGSYDSGGLVYRGTRARTKFSLSLNMYCEEIVDWTQKADEEDRRLQASRATAARISLSDGDSMDGSTRRRTRRALSCVS